MDISSASDHTTFPEPLFSPHGLLDSTTPSGKGAFAVQPAKKSAGAENTMPKISHRSHAPTDKRRKLKVLSAADNEFLLENVPSYVDTVTGTTNWASLMDDHADFAKGHTARQLSERWKQLRQELPSMEILQQSNYVREEATRKVKGWLLK